MFDMLTAGSFEFEMQKIRYSKMSADEKKKQSDELVVSVLKQFGYNSGSYEWQMIQKEVDSVKSDDRK